MKDACDPTVVATKMSLRLACCTQNSTEVEYRPLESRDDTCQ